MSYDRGNLTTLEESTSEGKLMWMKGIFVQGDVKNHNQRIYPTREIARAVADMSRRIQLSAGVQGELSHPSDLEINLDRVSHVITEMWMDGNDGYGKLKIIPTPTGNIATTMLKHGVKLGVSSRGSGNVGHDGVVSEFDIVTVDIVAQPSAPDAFPRAIYESLYNMKGGAQLAETARYAHIDPAAQKYLTRDVISFINDLKI